MIRIRDRKNFACALMFGAFAVLLAGSALTLRIGTASAMGPGYFPLALSLILAVLALLIGVASLRVEGAAAEGFEWRGVTAITMAILVFGATIQRLGFVPAVVLSLALTFLAKPGFGWRPAILLALILVAGCWLVFVRGLGLPVRLFAF